MKENSLLQDSIDLSISEAMRHYNLHEDEQWGKLRMCPERYVISTYGQIVRLARTSSHYDPFLNKDVARSWKERLLVGTPDSDGYLRVAIYLDVNKFKNMGIHRLVADTFLSNPDYETNIVVNHIDGNILNNHISNLEWCTCKDNTRNSINRKTFIRDVKSVKCLDTGETYPSVLDASKATGVPYDEVMNSIRNKYRCSHHLTFIYDGSIDNETNYLINSIRHFNPRTVRVPVDCLDADLSFNSIKAASDWIHVSPEVFIKNMDKLLPIKGHVFVRHSDNLRDKTRFMNYCYTKSEIYSDLATEPVYTLSDKAVVLSSGGLDSTTCLGLAISEYGCENVVSVSVYYGQKHDVELTKAKEIANYYGVEHYELDLSAIYSYSNCSLLKNSTEDIPTGTYADQLKALEDSGKLSRVSTAVPLRNGVMLAAVTSLSQSLFPGKFVDVYLGNHADDAAGHVYADCTVEFTSAMRQAIKEGSYDKVFLNSPFVNNTKADIVSTGIKLKVPYHLTTSCYNGRDKACQVCGTCRDRISAFRANGVPDPIEYEGQDPFADMR